MSMSARALVVNSWWDSEESYHNPALIHVLSKPSSFDTLNIPVLAVLVSIVILVLHSAILWWKSRKNPSETRQTRTLNEHVQSVGGPVIYAYLVLRTLTCLALLALSMANAAVKGSQTNLLMLSESVAYLYASMLAISTMTTDRKWIRIFSRHLVLILFVTLAVYVYRDVLPLATVDRPMQDSSEGKLLIAKLVLLTMAGVVIPLIMPRMYIPVDPKNPAETPAPEQVASIVSLAFYSFMDKTLWKGYTTVQLTWDQLPPLADYDFSRNLKAKSFKALDTFSGAPKRHLFFGLIRVFGGEYIVICLMIAIVSASNFIAPISIYSLLSYLEANGEGFSVRPWVFVAMLFVGPAINTLAMQRYVHLASRSVVRTEGIITQLIFEHALRIRVKAEVTEAEKTPEPATTPDNQSEVEGEGDGSEGSQDETLRSSTASVTSTAKPEDKKEPEKPTSKSDNLVGKIMNLITSDLQNITGAVDFPLILVQVPLQITFCIIFLYRILGWSTFVGFGVMLVLFPVPGYLAKLAHGIIEKKMKQTDARVQLVADSVNVARMIKLFGWEEKVEQNIAEMRDEELRWLRRTKIIQVLSMIINYVVPMLTMFATYFTYTVIMKKSLSAAVVFSSLTVFEELQKPLGQVFRSLNAIVSAKVSLERVMKFLYETELLDKYSPGEVSSSSGRSLVPEGQLDPTTIGFNQASFTWSNTKGDGSLSPSKRNFALQIDDELRFRHGEINLIIGATGSGKTSLLMALLGEMNFTSLSGEAWYHLPRERGVAYAPQEAWVQNDTIRNNILFGAEFDEARYNRVIYQCGLEQDLKLFDAGDHTEVGEKGLTLSGGQKARVTLARAIYSSAETLLLDDVLAALDVHTSKWIVQKCLQGDLVQGRTVILVTHNVTLAAPIAKFIVSVKNGRVHQQESLEEAIKADASIAATVKEDEAKFEKAKEVNPEMAIPAADESKSQAGKLILAEETEVGHVSWQTITNFLAALGGAHPVLFFAGYVALYCLSEVADIAQIWFLGAWGAEYEYKNPADVPALRNLGRYAILLSLFTLFFSLSFVVFVIGSIRASRVLHGRLVASVFGTTLRWLDTTPTSRIITRCTQDIGAVDGRVTELFFFFSTFTITLLFKFLSVVVVAPIALPGGVIVAVLGGICGQLFIRSGMAVKREMSKAKSPLIGHLSASLSGLVSIRAYNAEEAFRNRSLDLIDRYTRAARTSFNLTRWVNIRVNLIGGLFSASLGGYLVYGASMPANVAGFSLSQAVAFSSMILWWVRMFNDLEVQANSLERIDAYLHIEQERKGTQAGIPPAYWPASGDLRVEKLAAKYSSEGSRVLEDISFHIKSGERVGVGSGKSSLTLALLQCIITEGHIFYDGLDTGSVNLDALRKSITIIPQMPELLSGTLRQNLDPFDQYDDATLNSALQAAGLVELQKDTAEGKITLDSTISGGGQNLSVGQRQILALARAIVRQSKLLILDEATSAIDYKTDTIIQESLRSHLDKNTTLITVAHRLQTIMDADRIMVLDAGRIVEFDSPKNLLNLEKGKLHALVDQSGDKDVLYTLAGL